MIQAITDRRSIRKYQDKPVPRCMVEEIIRAGILAPSAAAFVLMPRNTPKLFCQGIDNKNYDRRVLHNAE